MPELNSFFIAWTPRFLSVLRVITGFLFVWHGSQKLFGFPPSRMDSLPPLMLIAAILEFFGGVLILIGFLTRPVAFLLSGFMAVAYFMEHAPQAFLPVQNGGELAVLYCFVFLFLSVAGGGEWSLDRLLSKWMAKTQSRRPDSSTPLRGG